MARGVITPDETRFISLILAGSTVRAAAEAVGIAERTAFQWLQKPHLREELDSLREGHVEAIRAAHAEAAHSVAELLQESITKIARALPQAIDTVIGILNDPEVDPSDRLKAFALLADRGGLRPGKEVVTRDRYDEMPLEDLAAEVEQILAESRRTA